MAYAIPEKRELRGDEKAVIEYLISKEFPELLEIVKRLKVIGRCGCGGCPTILLGEEFNMDIQMPSQTLVEYEGRDLNGSVVGVAILGNEKFPITELEVYVLGNVNGDQHYLPLISTLKK